MKDKKIIIILILTLILITMLLLVLKPFSNKSYDNSSNTSQEVEKLDLKIEYDENDDYLNWKNGEYEDVILEESINITKEGTYHLKGTIENGGITVNTSDDETVVLVLDGVNITNNSGSAIYVENAGKVIIIAQEGSVNTLADGEKYEAEDIDGCIYSKDDIVINGSGTLNINSNYSDGLVSKDGLTIINTNINVISNDDGIKGKDYVLIKNASISITAGADGIKSTNDEDTLYGYILIENSNITIEAKEDGIQAETDLKITNGEFNIETTGGYQNTNSITSSQDDSTYKGLKAGNAIEIENGTFIINSLDDCIHSNNTILIKGGTFDIKSGDDAIHADGLIQIDDGTFDITAQEGIEATYVKINGGTINISASDDGINAGNKSNSYSVTIEINGGYITIKMGSGDTDAIDSNGNLYINGGTLDISANSPFDYDKEAKYNGGTIIVNGTQTNTITNQFAGGGMSNQAMGQGQKMH